MALEFKAAGSWSIKYNEKNKLDFNMNGMKAFWILMILTIIVGLVLSAFLGEKFFNVFFYGKLA